MKLGDGGFEGNLLKIVQGIEPVSMLQYSILRVGRLFSKKVDTGFSPKDFLPRLTFSHNFPPFVRNNVEADTGRIGKELNSILLCLRSRWLAWKGRTTHVASSEMNSNKRFIFGDIQKIQYHKIEGFTKVILS